MAYLTILEPCQNNQHDCPGREGEGTGVGICHCRCHGDIYNHMPDCDDNLCTGCIVYELSPGAFMEVFYDDPQRG